MFGVCKSTVWKKKTAINFPCVVGKPSLRCMTEADVAARQTHGVATNAATARFDMKTKNSCLRLRKVHGFVFFCFFTSPFFHVLACGLLYLFIYLFMYF